MAKKAATKKKRPSELDRVEAERAEAERALRRGIRNQQRIVALTRSMRRAMRTASASLEDLRDTLIARSDRGQADTIEPRDRS